jgi:hypothetical protein
MNLIEFVDPSHGLDVEVTFFECLWVHLAKVGLLMLESYVQNICQFFHARQRRVLTLDCHVHILVVYVADGCAQFYVATNLNRRQEEDLIDLTDHGKRSVQKLCSAEPPDFIAIP